jgi:hypothetical protein
MEASTRKGSINLSKMQRDSSVVVAESFRFDNSLIRRNVFENTPSQGIKLTNVDFTPGKT